MYNLIKFHKDKITTWVFNDDMNDWKEVSLEDLTFPISDYFNHLVDFSDDLTVKDFIRLLNHYKAELDKHFSAYNHGYEFDIYYKESLKSPQPDHFKECDEIEIIWETDVQKENGINFILDWVTFCGRIKNFKKQHDFDIPTRGMQMSPLRDWKELPLKLNKMIFYEENSPTSLFKSRKSSPKLQGIKHFSLFEVLSGFIYELTCHGTPEQQISMANEVKAQIKSITENIFDVPISLIPLDAGIIKPIELTPAPKPEETLEDLNKKMKRYVDSEEFEKAQEIKEKISSINKKKEKSNSTKKDKKS